MCVSYLETCPELLQERTIEWFLTLLWDKIQDLSASEGCRWRIAVSLYLERLCIRELTYVDMDELNKSCSSDNNFEEYSAGEISAEEATLKKCEGKDPRLMRSKCISIL